jgi:Family of unknown function (DUF6444)
VHGTPDAPELRAENARLREAVERLGLLNQDKDAVIAGLRAQLAEQAEQIARLERLISRNSGNSSMPPGSDDQPGRKPPQPRQRQGGRKRRPGKQPGGAGSVPAVERSPGRHHPALPRLRIHRLNVYVVVAGACRARPDGWRWAYLYATSRDADAVIEYMATHS